MLDKKILFACKENDSFLIPIIDYLRKSYGDLVEIIRVDGHKQPAELYEFLNKCDLAWFEWCSDWCVNVTTGEKYCKLFIRLHSYEAFNIFPNMSGIIQNVNWNQVDELIVPNQNVIDVTEALKQYIYRDITQSGQQIPYDTIRPNIDRHKINIIPNIVDCQKIKIPNDKPYTKKLAWVGYINYKKHFELAVMLFQELLNIDPEFELHIAGVFQDPRERVYFDWITRNIPKNYDENARIFEYGWIDPEQLNEWFKDKTYILSTSLFESFHHGLAQGMAAGLIPLIHDWPGATNLYPKEFIWKEISDAIMLIQKFGNLTPLVLKDHRYNLRKHIVENFSSNKVLPVIKTLIDSHLYEKEFVNYFGGGSVPEGNFDIDIIRKLLEQRGKLK